MADLNPVTLSRAGAVDALSAASAGGDAIVGNTGKEWLEVNNGGGSPITVTLTYPATTLVDGQAPAAKTVVVAAANRRKIGPFPPGLWNDVNGKVQIAYSGVTTVTVGAFRMNPEF